MLAPFAGMVQGGVALERGDFASAVEQLTRALDAYAATGSGSYRALWCGLLARALAGAGQMQAAFQVLEGLLLGEPSHREGLWEADVHRIKGELLLCAEGAPAAGGGRWPRNLAAEACFTTALQMARKQSAKPLELRAALSLGRYWKQRGDTAPWAQLLREIYDRFDEGYGTSDLVRARSLLEELEAPAGSP
jgi:predicted ATPase